jgi:hypothetical protein
LAAVFGAIIAAGVLDTPVAHADEASYIEAVSNDGIAVTSVTLALGHEVCGAILAHGVAGVEKMASDGLSAGMSSDNVSAIIGDAVMELCPAGLPAVRAFIIKHHGNEAS